MKPTVPRIIQPEPDPVDYSDVFPLELLAYEGVLVFRIENLKPVLMPESAIGKFCVADCYLILKCGK